MNRQTLKTEKLLSSSPSRKSAITRFWRVRFQTPSVSFMGLSVSSFRPIICVPKRTHRLSRRTHRVCRRTQGVLSSETVLSKQYSSRSLILPRGGRPKIIPQVVKTPFSQTLHFLEREGISKGKCCPNLKPLFCRLKSSHGHFSKSFSPPKICTKRSLSEPKMCHK